jgi:hypothetical protein
MKDKLNLLEALTDFRNDVPIIHEGTKGYNYTYANLNTIFKAIDPLLVKHGLGFTQLLDGKNLKTILFHVSSGESLEGSVEIETNVKLAGMNHYQVFGSAITYFRRYSLSCMLGLITDKDVDSTGEEEKIALVTVLSDGKIDKIIAAKTQKAALQSIKDGKCTATEAQLKKLNA